MVGKNHRLWVSGSMPHTPTQFFWKYPLVRGGGGGGWGCSAIQLLNNWGQVLKVFILEGVDCTVYRVFFFSCIFNSFLKPNPCFFRDDTVLS